MGYRNIIIESPAAITVSRSQLMIRTDREHSVSPEDISVLLIESRHSTISTAALSLLGQCGCTVFFCDEKHMPCACLLPFLQHSRNLAVIRQQLNISEPLKKQLWKSIVTAKINNQAACLALSDREATAEGLRALALHVRSGDANNTEATAAAKYFKALFGPSFSRDDESAVNAALNYGYAIIRGCVARNLASYGFLPALGLHHRSELNAFNLADDMMEPFRPLIDLLVVNTLEDNAALTVYTKRQLVNALNLNLLSGGQLHSTAYAIERAVQSLSRSLSDGVSQLLLPELCELKQHSYE